VRNKELYGKCALCGKTLVQPGQRKNSNNIVQEIIEGSSYTFDTKYCAILFKRFLSVYGNDFKNFAGQEQYISDPFWNKAIPKEEEIREIEQEGGVKPEVIETIRDPNEIQKLAFKLIKSSKDEILTIFSTANAFHYQMEGAGAIQVLKEAAETTSATGGRVGQGLKIRILTPKDDLIEETVQKLRQQEQLPQQIGIRYIEPHLQTKEVSILVIDRKFSLAVQVKDDTIGTLCEPIELATYSNSKSTALSYATIFESLWKELELNEQLTNLCEKLKIQDNIQKNFINMAAHELKAPIQPILGLAQALHSKKKIDTTEHEELLSVIIRNAKRLKGLTENLLDLTRIESESLKLHKEVFNINEVILDSLQDIKSQVNDNKKVKLLYDLRGNIPIHVEADKGRLTQIISNLLSNAIKFTQEGAITVTVEKKEENDDNQTIVVNIKDTGSGIDSEIMPRLFTKFATKSETGGTGLGLFISKSIIEAHDGKIWAENNPDGEKGATFSFSLPIYEQKNE
jgi:two-component system sensor histidine kinase VicK